MSLFTPQATLMYISITLSRWKNNWRGNQDLSQHCNLLAKLNPSTISSMKISSLKTIIHTQRLIWKWLYNFNVLFFTTAILEIKLLFLDVTDFPRVLENTNIIIFRTVLIKIRNSNCKIFHFCYSNIFIFLIQKIYG